MTAIELDILKGAPDGRWMLDVPVATTLVLVGADDELTGIAQGLAAALADVVGEAVDLDRPEATPPEVSWIAALHVPGMPAPLLCWPEVEAVDGTGLPDDLEHRHGLVVQTLLHPGDPLTCLINLVRLLATADPNAPGLLDAETGRWLDRTVLERDFLGEAIEPAEDALWVVEATGPSETRTLRSRGLARCGRHELQIGPVQDVHVDAAADLIASVAALSLETPLPDEGVPAQVGPGLQVHLSEVEGGGALVDAGGRVPFEVLQRLTEGVAAVYRTDRSARRGRALANATWRSFLEFASTDTHECLVEVPFEDPEGESPRREHVWMRVASVIESAVLAEPVHEPMLAAGIDMVEQRITADEVASWRVMIDGHAWGPEQIDALRGRLRND